MRSGLLIGLGTPSPLRLTFILGGDRADEIYTSGVAWYLLGTR